MTQEQFYFIINNASSIDKDIYAYYHNKPLQFFTQEQLNQFIQTFKDLFNINRSSKKSKIIV